MKILILMSTYNGQKYLEEQLNSIARQENVNTSIIVRDDGSKDGTIGILEKYQKTMDITIIHGDNKGPAKSFMDLIRFAYKKELAFDYIAFCDQDDSWMRDKLKVATEKLEECDKSKPCLYFGAYQMTDSYLNPIETKISTPTIDIYHCLTKNVATGCTMVFNNKLLELSCLYDPEYIPMHDTWLFRLCYACGGSIIYDSMPHILYRQHLNNVIGGKGEGFLLRWKLRLEKLFKTGNHYDSKMAKELIIGYGNLVLNDYYPIIDRIANISLFKNRLFLAFNKHFYKNLKMEDIIRLFVLFLTGKI